MTGGTEAMNRPAPARADEELDVVLDGHRHLYASELGPAVEAARMLGAELRAIQIAPEVAERHIAMALARARYAAVRARWRSARRLAVAAVAAAVLVVGPAAMLAGAAIPGDPLYPLKRTIEAADLSLAMSPASEARAHTRIAGARLVELHVLYAKGRSGETSALAGQLAQVRENMVNELSTIAQGSNVVVSDEIAQQLHDALATSTTKVAPASSIPGAPQLSPTTASTAPPASAGVAPTSTEPPTTEPPTTAPPTTEPPTTAAPASDNQPGGNPGG